MSKAVDAAAKCLIIGILLIMTTTTTIQIICRYGLQSSLIWPEELNVFFMAWITYVGASVALRQSSHIGVELFVQKLPRTPRLIATLLGRCAIGYVVVTLIRFGYEVARLNEKVVSDALHISMAVPRASLVVGGVMMLIQLAYVIACDIRRYAVGREEA